MSIASLRSIALLLFMLGSAYLLHDVQMVSEATAANRPVVLVRILELSGTGPDRKSHVLFRNTEGYTTTLDSVGRVGSQVNGSNRADGDYHTLYVTLADDYKLLAQNGSTKTGSLSADGKPDRIRVQGMILVVKGHATAVRMLDGPSFYGYPKSRRGDDDD